MIGAWKVPLDMPAPDIGWPAIDWAGRSGKTAGLWSLRERRFLGASALAAVGAAVGFGRDLCSHVKPVSRGVGCGGFRMAEGRSVGTGAGADVGAGAIGAGGA